ncbi:MAG: LacI family DNA-binding transcriptional regulator [Phycisphaerae bacterium]
MRKARKHVTAADVADRAGVSQAAVSFALRNLPEVSEEVGKRIREIAKSMNYYPNVSGQLLQARRNGRSGQVGLIAASEDIVTLFTNPQIGGCIGNAVKYCIQKNLRYVIEAHHYGVDAASFQPPHHAAGGLCDGSVVIGDVGDALRQWLDQQDGYPWVSVFEPAEYCVLPHSDEGMFQAVRKLVELGHRRIAGTLGPLIYLTHRLRLKGFQRAIREYGLEVPEDWIATFDPQTTAEDYYRWTGKILTEPNRPTAILAAGGTQVIVHRATELGLHVPRDLSIISWAPAATRGDSRPRSAVIDHDLALAMRYALDMLMARIEGREVESKTCWVTPELVPDDSLGPAPRL